jgi:hypothetical protein
LIGGNRLIATLPALMPLRTPSSNSGPFPPPALPGLTGTTNPSAIPAGPACPSRASGCKPLPHTDRDFPCCLGSPLRTCRRQYPGGIAGSDRSRGRPIPTVPMAQRRRPSPEVWRVGSHITAFGACSAFTTRCGLPARGATLWPFASKAPAVSLPPPPLRLLPAGANQVPGGDRTHGRPLPYHGAHTRNVPVTSEWRNLSSVESVHGWMILSSGETQEYLAQFFIVVESIHQIDLQSII